MTPGLIQVLKDFEGAIYVASGSEHTELNHVFEFRIIAEYFIGIFGSPTLKSNIVKNIILSTKNENVLMIGDSESDFEASNSNNIDFVAYIPYSNVREKMLSLANAFKFQTIEHWSELC
jgi:phosphoglycolate phosphatase-like HAD superfamily hydrolase